VVDDGGAPCFIDAFAGCGGLSLGLLRAGWRGLFAIEKDAFAFATLKKNLIESSDRPHFAWPQWLAQKPWTIESLMDEHGARLDSLRGKVDLLAGGPPCQGFSSAGRRRPADPRNQLVNRYLEFVERVQPRMVLIENVRGITYDFIARSNGDERRNFAEEIIERLKLHYDVFSDTLHCSSYGVPQNRPRFFIVGFLRGLELPSAKAIEPFAALKAARKGFLKKRGLAERVSSYQAISDLERDRTGVKPCPDSKGFEALLTIEARTNFQKAMRQGLVGDLTDTRLARHLPHIVDRFERIIDECKQEGRLSVQLNREMRERYGIKKMATRVLDPSKPAPTITSMPDDLLHYAEPRTLTVRENARLQTFPDWFAFQGKYTTGGDRRAREVPRFTQVANAVPPLLAELWGEVLLKIHRTRVRSNKMFLKKRRKVASDAKRHKRVRPISERGRRASHRIAVVGRRSERRRKTAI
jgi:DNA (cytosine-5)-methyltransferase 1